jgi:hypothetical protein
VSAQNRNGLILLGAIVAVAGLVGLWRTAGAGKTCGATADPYGAPPAQFEYRRPDVGEQEQMIKRANLQKYERYGLETRFAMRDEKVAGTLISFTSFEDADRDQFEDELKELDGKQRFGDTDTRIQDLGDGAALVAGLKDGCYGMVVVGADRQTASTLAEAVFKD